LGGVETQSQKQFVFYQLAFAQQRITTSV